MSERFMVQVTIAGENYYAYDLSGENERMPSDLPKINPKILDNGDWLYEKYNIVITKTKRD